MELLTPKEKRILGALYKLGESPISKISKEILLNRTALYHTIEELLKKGLVTKITKEGGAFFQAISQDEYRSWAKRKISSLTEETSNLGDWLNNQQQQLPTLYSDIRYFEGVESVKNLYEDSWRENKDKKIYCITDYDKAYDTLNNFLEQEYFPDRVKRGISIKSLLPQSTSGKRDISRSKELLRDMRFLNTFKDLGIELNIYGSKVSIVAFDKKKPSGVIIKNEIIAKAFKNIFESLWATTKPIKSE
ncbi:MAG: helix-turn-helix domain-containing protein [Patescibacteria group bacterium]